MSYFIILWPFGAFCGFFLFFFGRKRVARAASCWRTNADLWSQPLVVVSNGTPGSVFDFGRTFYGRSTETIKLTRMSIFVSACLSVHESGEYITAAL